MKRMLLIAVLCCCATLASAQEIVVAAAADLSAVFPEIISRFEKETGRKVRANFGSSGNFLLQIENGAPFDLYFSADVQYPQRLESEGLTQPVQCTSMPSENLFSMSANSQVNLAQGLRALESPGVKRIAIANPQHAPYGRAAVEALKKEDSTIRCRANS